MFGDFQSRKFHATYLVLRDLSVDVENLELTPPISYKASYSSHPLQPQRNHFQAHDKESMDPMYFTYPMLKNHKAHEGKQIIIASLIDARFSKSRDCPVYYKKYIDYQQKWDEYLEMRDYIEKKGVIEFIIKYLTEEIYAINPWTNKIYAKEVNYFLDRYYKDVPKSQLENEIKKILQWGYDQGYGKVELPWYAKNLQPQGTQTTITHFLGSEDS